MCLWFYWMKSSFTRFFILVIQKEFSYLLFLIVHLNVELNWIALNCIEFYWMELNLISTKLTHFCYHFIVISAQQGEANVLNSIPIPQYNLTLIPETLKQARARAPPLFHFKSSRLESNGKNNKEVFFWLVCNDCAAVSLLCSRSLCLDVLMEGCF